MQTVNQILITLREADAFARSQNPHHHRLAVVLLDNIIELQLRRKSEWAFAFDRTNRVQGVRKHDRNRRRKVERDYAELLSLAVSEDWITEDESKLLAFAHRIRNRAYHVGYPEDRADLPIGISLLYRFVRRYFPKWRNASFGLGITSETAIPVECVSTDRTGWAPLLFGLEDQHPDFSSEEHWSHVLDHCLTFEDAADLRPLIKNRLENLLDEIESCVYQITEEQTNFVPILAHRFSKLSHVFCCDPQIARSTIGPAGALNIYLAVLGQEERLLDLADEAAREEEFHKLLGGHSFDPHVLSMLNIEGYRALAHAVIDGTESAGIESFLKIERELKTFRYAARECASDLDEYTSNLIDELRGK